MRGRKPPTVLSRVLVLIDQRMLLRYKQPLSRANIYHVDMAKHMDVYSSTTPYRFVLLRNCWRLHAYVRKVVRDDFCAKEISSTAGCRSRTTSGQTLFVRRQRRLAVSNGDQFRDGVRFGCSQ